MNQTLHVVVMLSLGTRQSKMARDVCIHLVPLTSIAG